ncbi:hypothetical protein P3X46_017697 [Hevea brasiliensis]|uniref:Prolamin-like domain-containing protein n=1 Tax=Hevea brasiliensis TaxID=3981 RepID=A0ABQ9LQG7_HEVBR|nr:hypothetical protein P3X46_017697 [Hevea brasiliensis]
MRSSIGLIFVLVLVCLARLSEAASGGDCGCIASCFGCPYEIRTFQIGRGSIESQCTCVCQCPSNPSFPSPNLPAPSTPRVPSAPLALSPACAASAVNLGFCWAEASLGTVFQNVSMAQGCCSVFKQWADDCFGGDERIPSIVSHWVPPALVQYCSTQHYQCTCVCQCPSNPSFPSPNLPAPSTPRVPSAPLALSPACAASAVNLGFCWAEASLGTVFQNVSMAQGCCSVFKQWADDCFGGDERIPSIVSHWVPHALVQYCSTQH